MIALIQLATKQLLRHRLRTALTVCGVASGMFLFTAVETLQKSLALATEETAADTTLVVYRENRYCPMASQLPEYYQDEIREMKGVHGLHVMAFKQEDRVPEIVERSGVLAGRVPWYPGRDASAA